VAAAERLVAAGPLTDLAALPRALADRLAG
jgi:hypothetical protein